MRELLELAATPCGLDNAKLRRRGGTVDTRVPKDLTLGSLGGTRRTLHRRGGCCKLLIVWNCVDYACARAGRA